MFGNRHEKRVAKMYFRELMAAISFGRPMAPGALVGAVQLMRKLIDR